MERNKTPLYPVYAQYGAKTIDFGGWDLPVQFSSIGAEHEAVRQRAGLFDVSHMGEFIVEGADAASFLQGMLSNDIDALSVGQAQYSIMCYPDGGTVDDLLVYRVAEQRYMVVVNAANRAKDLEWLTRHQQGAVEIRDVSDETALLALQGPLAEQILSKLTTVPLAQLLPFHFLNDVQVGDVSALVSRSGYTGEDGFELYVRSEQAIDLWEHLLHVGQDEGLLPVGLGARDTLRFEARLPLYGQELSASISPLEAGLGFAVKLNSGPFIGSEALAAQKNNGVPRKLAGLEMIDRGIPRTGYPVYAGDRQIGVVTTGTQSPTLKKNVGFALIDSAEAVLGNELLVEIRGKRLRAQVIKTPFYKRG